MTKKARKCMECGAVAVLPTAKGGRFTRYHAVPKFEIPAELEIPTCQECGTEWVDEDTAERLDSALEERYSKLLIDRATAAIEQLRAAGFSQSHIEEILGLSQGYISKLRSGKRPSESLVVSLALYAREPSRIKETERLWNLGASSKTG
jgi:hypothetical protein